MPGRPTSIRESKLCRTIFDTSSIAFLKGPPPYYGCMHRTLKAAVRLRSIRPIWQRGMGRTSEKRNQHDISTLLEYKVLSVWFDLALKEVSIQESVCQSKMDFYLLLGVG